jgi:hypothetical protein
MVARRLPWHSRSLNQRHLMGNRKFVDFLLEGNGFEPSVPRHNKLCVAPATNVPGAIAISPSTIASAVARLWIVTRWLAMNFIRLDHQSKKIAPIEMPKAASLDVAERPLGCASCPADLSSVAESPATF